VEDRAHAEIDRVREETKALQALFQRPERESPAMTKRLETTLTTVRAAERAAAEQSGSAKTLEQQLARMDGPPASLAAQQAWKAATQREAALQAKLDRFAGEAKAKPAAKKRRPPGASGFS
jgi:septal ring factor EnvC (AmiA/AmiB activator)